MLRSLTAAEMQAQLAAFWPVALDLTRSGYPTYTDGVKTFDDFSATVRHAVEEPWGEVLVHVYQGEVNGLIVVEQVDEEYLSLPVCLASAHQEALLNELLDHLMAHYPGRTLWLGFAPENIERLAYAKANGFALLDDTTNWQFPLASWTKTAVDRSVAAISRDNYADFRSLWTDAEMYWNADRIAEDLDRWHLFVCADDAGPTAAVACMKDRDMQEIFGFMYKGHYDASCHAGLLCACLNTAQRDGSRDLTYFAGAEENAVMAEMGFQRVSGYVCYEKRL